MEKLIVKKKDQETVYKRETIDHVLEVNGKTVRVREYTTTEPDEIDNDSPYINQADEKLLTEEEHDSLHDYIGDALDLKVGEEFDFLSDDNQK